MLNRPPPQFISLLQKMLSALNFVCLRTESTDYLPREIQKLGVTKHTSPTWSFATVDALISGHQELSANWSCPQISVVRKLALSAN